MSVDAYDLPTKHPTWSVHTESEEAQRWCDEGRGWLVGFNHGEAERCFAAALRADCNLAYAHWAMAYAAGA